MTDPAVQERRKLGIIQSRGLGDIVIALPIARAYWTEGHDIYWPICQEFIASFEESVPWVNWLAIETDPVGKFFLETPLLALKSEGIEAEEDILYLYQYLSSVPERTDPDLFAMMKFDQYKYAVAGVPFARKWHLAECITRDPAREQALYDRVVTQDRYMVYQGTASDVKYEIDLSPIDPAVQRIEITDITDNIFDWLKVIEGAESIILIDSVFANLIDQLGLCEGVPKYYMRKWNRRVDGNPVLLGDWNYIPVSAPEGMEVRSLADGPAPQPQPQSQPQQPARPQGGSAQTYTPFGQSKGNIPTSFLGATEQGRREQAQKAPNVAQNLLASLGLRQ